jgi:hypothetical protein
MSLFLMDHSPLFTILHHSSPGLMVKSIQIPIFPSWPKVPIGASSAMAGGPSKEKAPIHAAIWETEHVRGSIAMGGSQNGWFIKENLTKMI